MICPSTTATATATANPTGRLLEAVGFDILGTSDPPPPGPGTDWCAGVMTHRTWPAGYNGTSKEISLRLAGSYMVSGDGLTLMVKTGNTFGSHEAVLFLPALQAPGNPSDPSDPGDWTGQERRLRAQGQAPARPVRDTGSTAPVPDAAVTVTFAVDLATISFTDEYAILGSVADQLSAAFGTGDVRPTHTKAAGQIVVVCVVTDPTVRASMGTLIVAVSGGRDVTGVVEIVFATPSPTTSAPTLTPTWGPATAGPTLSPMESVSPTTSDPTRSPTLSPTGSPTTVRPRFTFPTWYDVLYLGQEYDVTWLNFFAANADNR